MITSKKSASDFLLGSVIILSLLLVAPSHARDTIHEFSIVDALESYRADGLIDEYIHLYFHDQPTPPIERKFGKHRTNKKTNAFNKTDLEACQWAFLSAIRQLQHRADGIGANAVINIQSNYKGVTFKSTEVFRCGAGGILAGVALKAEIVNLKEVAAPQANAAQSQDQSTENLDTGPSD